MAKTKVLVITSELHGGSAFYVMHLVKTIAGAGAEVLVGYFPNNRSFEADLRELGVGVVALRGSFKSASGFPRNCLTLRNVINRERPDVIFTNTTFPVMSIAALRAMGWVPKKTKVVHTLHSFFSDMFRLRALRGAASIFERIVGKFVDVAIAPSEYMLAIGVRLYPSKTILIRNALDPQLESKLVDIRRRRPTSRIRPPFTLLFVGRAHRQKGLDVLLPAFKKLRVSHDVRLVLAGVSLSELERIAGVAQGENSRIECKGWVSETADLYLDADLFVIPSRWEAFGLTLLEARMAGVPCVGSRVDAIPELIGDNCGVTTEPGNVDALASALALALSRLTEYASNYRDGDLPTLSVQQASQLKLLATIVQG